MYSPFSNKEKCNYFLQKARKCLEKNNFQQAAYFYNMAIQQDNYCAEAYCGLGNVCSDLDNETKAESYYTKAINYNLNTSEAYLNRGNIFYKRGQVYRAISDYWSALKCPDENSNRYKDAAYLLYDLLKKLPTFPQRNIMMMKCTTIFEEYRKRQGIVDKMKSKIFQRNVANW